MVGEPDVNAVALSFHKFRLGEITRLSFDIENNWNKDISEVYGTVSIVDDSGNIVSEFKTDYATVSSYGIGRIVGYWDTEDLVAGHYRLLLNLNYDDRVSEQSFDLIVGSNTVNVMDNAVSGNVASTGSNSSIGKIGFLILLVLVILGVNIFILMKVNKRR